MDIDEPRYVDAGDEFEDNAWRYPQTLFERTVLTAAGHKYFSKQVQAKRIRAIESRSTGVNPKYPPDFLKEVIRWCNEKNAGRVIIGLDALISALRNPDNLARFYAGKPAVEDRSGYDTN